MKIDTEVVFLLNLIIWPRQVIYVSVLFVCRLLVNSQGIGVVEVAVVLAVAVVLGATMGGVITILEEAEEERFMAVLHRGYRGLMCYPGLEV